MRYLLILNAVVTAALAVVAYRDHQTIPVVRDREELVRLINANVACLTESSGGTPIWLTDWEYVDACLNDKGWLPWPQPPGYLHIWERMERKVPTQVEMLQRTRAAIGQRPGATGAIEHSLERILGLTKHYPVSGGFTSVGKSDFDSRGGTKEAAPP
jgi:hypothetical protein